MCSGRSGAKSNAAPIVCVWLVVTEGGGRVRGVACKKISVVRALSGKRA